MLNINILQKLVHNPKEAIVYCAIEQTGTCFAQLNLDIHPQFNFSIEALVHAKLHSKQNKDDLIATAEKAILRKLFYYVTVLQELPVLTDALNPIIHKTFIKLSVSQYSDLLCFQSYLISIVIDSGIDPSKPLDIIAFLTNWNNSSKDLTVTQCLEDNITLRKNYPSMLDFLAEINTNIFSDTSETSNTSPKGNIRFNNHYAKMQRYHEDMSRYHDNIQHYHKEVSMQYMLQLTDSQLEQKGIIDEIDNKAQPNAYTDNKL